VCGTGATSKKSCCIRLDPTDAAMSIAISADTGTGHTTEPARSTAIGLPPVPQSARTARRFAHATLIAWRLDARADDIDLVVSELITNALLHARSGPRPPDAEIRLELEQHGNVLTCRVADSSCLPPAKEDASTSAESGRGLLLVDALSTSWGWHQGPGGKYVWAEFDLS
jgi:anti-sigma regulatory factor (Ser/Thr protein kinase)